MDLAEVAADVAQALGLERYPAGLAKKDGDFFVWLNEDGSNLTDPYWRCACEDWLLENGVSLILCPDNKHDLATFSEFESGDRWNSTCEIQFTIECQPAEAPARLVSAVWRKQHSEENL